MADYQGETLTCALRNHKEFRQLPNYMHKDMRKKGEVTLSYSVKSSVKKYIDETAG